MKNTLIKAPFLAGLIIAIAYATTSFLGNTTTLAEFIEIWASWTILTFLLLLPLFILVRVAKMHQEHAKPKFERISLQTI